mgnify:CR=1 FL=1
MKSLMSIAYNAINDKKEKDYAADILCGIHDLTQESISIFSQPYYKRKVEIHASDRFGMRILATFFKRGTCQLCLEIRKKRSMEIYIFFVKDGIEQQWIESPKWTQYGDLMKYPFWESIIHDLPKVTREYIIDRKMSKKWKTLKKYVTDSIQYPERNVEFVAECSSTNQSHKLNV